ncbi:hypothetical protein CCACVL1_18301, partial [Corchorus capsularis]
MEAIVLSNETLPVERILSLT